MDQLSALALAILVSAVVSTIVTVVMTEPLRIVLRQLCLDSNATAFWVAFTTIMFYVTRRRCDHAGCQCLYGNS